MRNLFGLIIVILGIGFLLRQLNIPGIEIILSSWWPILIIAAGVYLWTTNAGSRTAPMIIILVGAILLLDQVNVLDQSAWNLFWPIILIIVGARLIMGRSWLAGKQTSNSADATAIFSGVDRSVAGAVADSDISAAFGGIKLDLRQAEFPDQATFNVFTAFGGIELLVPKKVKVVTRVLPLFGGADDKTSPDPSATKTLNINGTALFGGVSIKN